MNKLILICLITLHAAASYALNLTEAINLAVHNNNSIKQQKTLLEAQRYSGRTAMAPFLPAAGLNYSYTDTDTYGSDNAGWSEASHLRADISYNIFNGFADWNNYQLSRNAFSGQLYTYQRHTQDIILEVKTVYINYLKSQSDLAVASHTLELLEEQKRIIQLRMKVGELQESDLLKIEVQLAATRLELLEARTGIRIFRKQLERFISRNIPDSETVEPITLAEPYDIPPLADLEKMLEESRSEIQYAKNTYEAAVLAKDISKGQFLPKLDIGLSYGFYGDHKDPFGHRVNNYDSNRVVSLSASWSLFNGFSDLNTYKAKAKAAGAAAYALSDLRQQLQIELFEAYEQYFSAQERISVAEAGVNSAKENYRIVDLQFQYSEATTSDLLDASVALNKASTSLTKARYDFIAAVAALERAVETNFLGLDISI